MLDNEDELPEHCNIVSTKQKKTIVDIFFQSDTVCVRFVKYRVVQREDIFFKTR
jgi:hypothetical protein